jgi:hypothetical protein
MSASRSGRYASSEGRQAPERDPLLLRIGAANMGGEPCVWMGGPGVADGRGVKLSPIRGRAAGWAVSAADVPERRRSGGAAGTGWVVNAEGGGVPFVAG